MSSAPITEATTLPDLLSRALERFPNKTFEFFPKGPVLSTADLVAMVDRFAGNLYARGVDKGELIGVLLPTGPALIASIFATPKCGGVFAPLAVPMGARHMQAAYERLRHIFEQAKIKRVITEAKFAPLFAAAGLGVEVLTPEELDQAPTIAAPPGLTGPDDLALVQYTSGSTSTPKGVSLTNAQVLAGIVGFTATAEMTDTDVHCTWLPLAHDMGLISTLMVLSCGANQYLSSPAEFIKNPRRWLAYFSDKKASLYCGPNFSYQYMLDEVSGEQVTALDLSAWRLAFNGAEPIDPMMVQRFIQRFAAAGFKPETMYPVYGLAEVTLAATFPTPGEPVHIDWVDGDALSNERIVTVVEESSTRARGVVGVGRAVQGLEVRVVGTREGPRPGEDQEWTGDVLPDRRVGQIQIKGGSVMQGYYNDPGRTAAAFEGEWLCTGDLGYMVEGRLYPTGRIKEMMILRGQNYYPEDVEALVRDLKGLYRQRCIAFVAVDEEGVETMSVIVETNVQKSEDRQVLAKTARKKIGEVLGIADLVVYLVRPRTIRRTTSGKFQRLLMQELVKAKALGKDLLEKYVWAEDSRDTIPPAFPPF